MNEVIKSGNLKGSNRCKFKREHDVPLETGKRKENVYDKAALIKDIIKAGIYHGYDEDEVKQKLIEGYEKMDYPTPETARLHALDAYRQIMRYLTSETRKPVPSGVKVLDIFGLCEVEVRPDFVFKGYREFERTVIEGKNRKKVKLKCFEPYIEVVKICCKAPDVTLTGRSKDTGAKQNLELYSMLQYGRSLLSEKDCNINVGASFYFLRKKSDSANKNTFEPEFFNNKGAGNIVTLWETHHIVDDLEHDFSPEAKAMDDLFKPQFEEFVAGEEMCGNKACDNCCLNQVCNYTKPPIRIEKERKQKSLSNLVLTDEQENAIAFRHGIARINAGAGAGKTLVTALRIANMLDEGVLPEEIILLTFTNTGAEEMREHIWLYADDLGCDADLEKLSCTTFHSFGDRVIRDNYQELGFTEEPHLIDEVERSKIIADLLKENVVPGLDYRNFKMNMPYVKGALQTAKEAFAVIKKNRLSRGDEESLKILLGDYSSFITEDAGLTSLLELYDEYDAILHERNLIEYADQEMLIMDLLQKNPYYFEDFGYRHIMVDEYQDTSPTEFELLKVLIDSPDFESFMVVGDDSQSIFSFQGSSPEYIINFYEKLCVKEGMDFYLLENHRSTPEIITYANQMNELNEHRVEKDLVATREHGTPVSVNQFWKKEDEEAYIVSLIKELKEKYDYEDMAYITFSRDELLRMGTVLTEHGIPWILLNPEPTLKNSRVMAAIGLLKFMKDPTDTASAFLYLNAASDNTMMEKTNDEIMSEIESLQVELDDIQSLPAARDVAALKRLLEVLDVTDEIYAGFLKKLLHRKTLEEIIEYGHDFYDYGEKETEKREKDYPGVVLTTAHSSKGKEWPVVFNGISHYHTKRLAVEDVEEKRRLLFVSATRARDLLYITSQSVAFGDKDNRTYNRFLVESFHVLGKEFSGNNPYDKTTKSA